MRFQNDHFNFFVIFYKFDKIMTATNPADVNLRHTGNVFGQFYFGKSNKDTAEIGF